MLILTFKINSAISKRSYKIEYLKILNELLYIYLTVKSLSIAHIYKK